MSANQLVEAPSGTLAVPVANTRQAVAIGEADGPPLSGSRGGLDDKGGGSSGGGGGLSDEDALQARLDALRRG